MKPRIALAALSFWLMIGCQVALGDFTIDTSHLGVSCIPDTSRCEGNQIQTCVNGNEWRVLDTCESSNLCNLRTLTCAPCQPGTYQCNGAQPQHCETDLHWMDATPAPCAVRCEVTADFSSGRCVVCDTGETRCDGSHLQHCAPSRDTWQDTEVCASADQCNAANTPDAGPRATCTASP